MNSHQRFKPYALDVSDAGAVTKWAANYVSDFGTADILINNAGIAVVDHFENTELNDFERVMSIDYFGVVNMTKAVLPCMKTKGSGHIVNISSMLGFMGVYGYSAYCPAKFAVSAFSEVMRYELDKYNIKVSVVYPPDVDTPQLAMCDATMPEVTRSLSGFARALSAPEAARAIIRGVEKEQYVINLGFVNKAIYVLNRWFPSIVARVAFSTIRRLERAA
jgi:3-dehydrosphinganine reductase